MDDGGGGARFYGEINGILMTPRLEINGCLMRSFDEKNSILISSVVKIQSRNLGHRNDIRVRRVIDEPVRVMTSLIQVPHAEFRVQTNMCG